MAEFILIITFLVNGVEDRNVEGWPPHIFQSREYCDYNKRLIERFFESNALRLPPNVVFSRVDCVAFVMGDA